MHSTPIREMDTCSWRHMEKRSTEVQRKSFVLRWGKDWGDFKLVKFWENMYPQSWETEGDYLSATECWGNGQIQLEDAEDSKTGSYTMSKKNGVHCQASSEMSPWILFWFESRGFQELFEVLEKVDIDRI